MDNEGDRELGATRIGGGGGGLELERPHLIIAGALEGKFLEPDGVELVEQRPVDVGQLDDSALPVDPE